MTRKKKKQMKRIRRYIVHIAVGSIIFAVLAAWVFVGFPGLYNVPPKFITRQVTKTVSVAHASTAGPSTLGAAATATGWTNVTLANLNTDNNVTYATCSGCSTTNFAKLTTFGFNIGSTNTIVGISVTTNGYGDQTQAARRQFRIALSKDGTNTVGTAKTGQQFTTSDGDVTSGSASDLWGTTFTPAEVNATTFGVFWADNDSTTHNLFFDYVTITITYNTPYDGTWATGAADFKIYQDSTTTWDAGVLICSGTLTDDNAATIGCTSSAIAASTQYRVQVRLKNAGEVTATMDGASEYVDHKAVKAGWAGTSPTLGSCVFNDAGSDDVATATCSVAFNVNDVRITESGSGSVTIAGSGNEGFAYLITTDSVGLTKTNSTSYFDTSIDSVVEDSSKITITGPNIKPTGTFNSAAQKTDGTGIVDISIEVNDTDVDNAKAKVEYVSGAGCTGTWTKATLQTPITVDCGSTPNITNADAYQVGSTTAISTACSNTVQFDWASASNIPTGNTTFCLRLTVNDGTDDQATPATQTLTIDNVDPTTPGNLADGGKTKSSVTLTFGSQSSETNFSQYKIYYKQAASGVDTDDTQHSDADLAFINYNGTANTTVSGLSAATQYVFNIWAYDTYGNVATSTGSGTSGPLNSGSYSDDASTGTFAWSGTTCSFSSGGQSHYLKAQQFGFNIPTNATINGIKLEIQASASSNLVSDTSVRLVQGGSIAGNDLLSGTELTGTPTYYTYGGTSELWGLSWTAAQVNATNFGAVVSYLNDAAGSRTATVGNMRITVYYTAGELAVTTLANSAPNGTLNSAAQKTDGTGVVDISTTVSDSDGDLSKAKVEYVSGSGCTGTWTKATLQTPITATYSDTGGVPDITNANAYQVGTTATTQIKTASGANTVDFDWASATDVASGNGTYCLRLTTNDFTADDASPATRTLTIDNVAPTAPGNLTDGGKTSSTVTLTFGAQTTETNFSQYKIYYKAGVSGVTESDTQWTDTDLSFINYNGTANTVVTGLSANTAYVFNIWAYDSYGKKANATEISITTSAGATVNFDMQTGYYVGTGADNFQITAPGWSPDFVMIKDDNTNGTDGPIFKTSVMSGESAALFEAEADIGTDTIQSLDATGFTVGTYADVNAASTRFHWIAFDGSTCNSNGTFCVGSYTGDGAATKAITSVGFQPDLVIVKGAGATEAVWRSSAMATNAANFLTTLTLEDTGGTYFTTLNSTGFTVGNNAAVNTNGTTYWYVAFKQIATRMKVSSYTGNGTAGTSIGGVGFAPDFVFTKGANNTSSQWGVYNVTESNEDFSSYFNDAANAKNLIQQLEADGFKLGSSATVNESTKTYYYAAFGGAVDPTPSGTFTMSSGSYVGTGTGLSVTGVGFSPDLVIIKSSGTVSVQATYFRHRLMSSTGAFVNLGYISDAINSFDSDGFTIGAAAGVNTSGEVYHWQAFGNAFDPLTNSGAADFAIGAYTGNVGDNRNILRVGFQPDLVVIKYSAGLINGQFRTSSHVGDVSSFFTATADGSNAIQALNSDGFQIGTSININLSALYYFFVFKVGTNFKVGTYTGNGTSQSISGLGFRPDLVWAKSSSAYNGVMRSDSMTASSTAYFASTANSDDQIWAIDADGFTVGSQNETNGSTLTYWRMAWNNSSARWGTLYSGSIDTDSYPSIYNKNAVRMVWNQTVPSGCLLQMYVRSTNTTGASPDYASSTWQGPYVGYTSIGRANLAGNAFLQGKRYFQYRVDMYSCYLNNRMPTLYDVTLEFD